jgi:hypothetical protein
MAKTLERKEGGVELPTPREAPAQEMISAPEKKVALHEMPDLSKEAPEVTYGQPERSWLRYLAVGLTVGAIAVGGGLVISAVTTTETAPQFGNEYSLAREHLAQTPGGFPILTDSGQAVANSQKLQLEHLVQAPPTTLDMYGGQPYVRPDSPSVQVPPTTLDMYGGQPYVRPDSPSALSFANEGPVNDAPGAG